VKVVIKNLDNRTVDISENESLLKGLTMAGLDWMHACGGKGRCTTCKAQVVKGTENFTPPSPAELRYRLQGQLLENERLACQVRLRGDAVLCVPDECKLPHVPYTANR
jgi:ferredoxin, 2Fe-2S